MDKIAKLPSVRRLPSYLHILQGMQMRKRDVVSTTHLAREMGLEPIVVRKDLAITGAPGKPGVGYVVNELINSIHNFLGWNNVIDAFLVGTGHLGTALLGYGGFANHGLKLTAAFDCDPEKIGKTVNGHEILPMEKLPALAARMHVHMAVLTVPAEAAQEAADMVISGGIKGIWNFSPVKLKVPDGVVTQSQDLTEGLAVLSLKICRLLDRESAQPD